MPQKSIPIHKEIKKAYKGLLPLTAKNHGTRATHSRIFRLRPPLGIERLSKIADMVVEIKGNRNNLIIKVRGVIKQIIIYN